MGIRSGTNDGGKKGMTKSTAQMRVGDPFHTFECWWMRRGDDDDEELESEDGRKPGLM